MRGSAISSMFVTMLAPLVLLLCACTSDDTNDGSDTQASAETGTECVSAADCDAESPYCVAGSCESGIAGAPCEFASDCSMDAPYCALSSCSEGALGDPCEFADHCVSMYCGIDTCTEGNEGEPCEFPSDCNETAPFCPDVDPVCTDGSEGDPCSFQAECQDGLSCDMDACTAP